jgi:hypothetical protein
MDPGTQSGEGKTKVLKHRRKQSVLLEAIAPRFRRNELCLEDSKEIQP